MSQQYGPPQGPPAPGGWGPGPGGYPPPPPFRPARRSSSRTKWIVIAGAALAVVLITTGAVLLITGGKEDAPVATTPVAGETLTPAPVGTLYTPPTPSPTKTEITKGPHDTGVEIGGGVWFTPAKGWVKDTDKTRSGHNYLLPEPGRPGAIDGWFWIRQTKLMGAKAFADHLVDVESNNLQHVVIGKGGFRTCPNKALKLCYATNYSAVVPVKGKKPVVFSGFVQTFEDHTGQTTATDSALQREVWAQRKQEILTMNGTLVRSF
ncbi:hypothetical protein Kfla_3111 [Kribbella flavida DSM 17836]|uniref:Uncharacterized protein n=1 Tax=Kribbella flavida (strain DSM 17836 / JCM 10339 / NBRC 14399) TaxID=479435 RepID=D2Q350_KRIFD|nr:hypothetical protein [Kribbella flavida]ADB32175.1 hypothetical protein Kfla_3111 [Kribbella flavida DSM 17836]